MRNRRYVNDERKCDTLPTRNWRITNHLHNTQGNTPRFDIKIALSTYLTLGASYQVNHLAVIADQAVNDNLGDRTIVRVI